MATYGPEIDQLITACEISQPYNKYLLLAECEVRTASYGPSFFPSFYKDKEGKNEDP